MRRSIVFGCALFLGQISCAQSRDTAYYHVTKYEDLVDPELYLGCWQKEGNATRPSTANGPAREKVEHLKTDNHLLLCKSVAPPTPAVADGLLSPVVRVAPVYPARALSQSLEGYVDLSFTVTAEGTVRNPTVVYSTDTIFEEAAIQAVLRYIYKPVTLDGELIDSLHVKTRITFWMRN
jgi:TonB family protein